MSITPNMLVADLGSLPPISHVATQILRLTSDPDCSVSELQRVIGSDQAIAAQILKIANSATFGMMREVRTLSQAIMTLGLNTVKSVVVASSAKDLYMRATTPFQMAIWEHSLVSALAGRAIAKIFRFPAYDEVFLGGLMHDIGKSVIFIKYPDVYGKILKSVNDGQLDDSLQAEIDAFGFDHAMVGEALSEAWNLPRTFSQCVRWHHNPGGAEPENIVLASYVALGNLFALEVGKGIGKPQSLVTPKADALEHTGITEEALAAQREVVLDYLELDRVLITGF